MLIKIFNNSIPLRSVHYVNFSETLGHCFVVVIVNDYVYFNNCLWIRFDITCRPPISSSHCWWGSSRNSWKRSGGCSCICWRRNVGFASWLSLFAELSSHTWEMLSAISLHMWQHNHCHRKQNASLMEKLHYVTLMRDLLLFSAYCDQMSMKWKLSKIRKTTTVCVTNQNVRWNSICCQ